MGKLHTSPRLPKLSDEADEDLKRLVSVLEQRLRTMAVQINMVSEGRIAGAYNATTAQPTGGVYAVGDFVRKSDPTEEGTAGSKYAVAGWLFLTDGTASASTSVECRYLTGN